MKIGLYTDTHFSKSSSIVVGKRNAFSGRLENLKESFEWMNNYFESEKVDYIFCLGDLVDKPVLNSEEITAMSTCGIDSHYIILGNHCRSDKDGNINSISNFSKVITKPGFLFDGIYALPYNSDIVDLRKIEPRPRIILSHNDIKGYSINGHTLESGYEVSDILDSCDLFINGHLHNGGWVVKDRVVNLGQLSGINFSSCGGEWEPSIAILDTEDLSLKIIENPKALRFKKLEFDSLFKLKGFISNLPSEGKYVLQVKVPSRISLDARKLLDQSTNVYASRVVTYKDKKEETEKPSFSYEKRDIFSQLSDFIDLQNSKKPLSYSVSKIKEVIKKASEMTEGEE